MILVILIIRLWSLKGRYVFDLVQMMPGVNKYTRVKSDKLEFKHKIGDMELEIESDRLYRVKSPLHEKIIFWIRGISNKFLVIYRKGKNKPVKFETSKVSARTMKIIEESRALEAAMKDEFSIPWDMKKFIIVLGALIIISVTYLVMTGQVVI